MVNKIVDAFLYNIYKESTTCSNDTIYYSKYIYPKKVYVSFIRNSQYYAN